MAHDSFMVPPTKTPNTSNTTAGRQTTTKTRDDIASATMSSLSSVADRIDKELSKATTTTTTTTTKPNTVNRGNVVDNDTWNEPTDTGPSSIPRGRDSNGTHVFSSVKEMWLSQGVLSTGKNKEWYERAADYYEQNCDTTVNGVLGGFASISDMDLNWSRSFLHNLRSQRPSLDWTTGAACECGAGIGRVTKGLFLPLDVPRCDLVESSARLLGTAPDYIGDPGAERCRFYCEGLQDWEPPVGTYSIVWIQWVLIYLTNADIVAFLKRCGQSLRPGGVVVLKENTCEEDDFVLDSDDASVTRSRVYWRKLIDEAGLRIVHEEVQDDFPEELFPVPILALEVKQDE